VLFRSGDDAYGLYFQDGKFVALSSTEQKKKPGEGFCKYSASSGYFTVRESANKDIFLNLMDILKNELEDYYSNWSGHSFENLQKILRHKSLPQEHRDAIGELLE
jgi:hypothetical protein